MTQTAHVPAREPVPENQREAARLDLELQPGTLLSRAALLYKRICDSLILCLKIKEPHCRRNVLHTGIMLCAGHAGARYQEPDSTDRCLTVSAPASRTRAVYVSRARVAVCGRVRIRDARRRRWKGATV